MANLSQIKRDKMIAFLDKLKEQHSDDESLIAINQIAKELSSKKYGLIWEEHEEEVDIKMQTHIPVFTEDKDKEIIGDPNNEQYNFLLEGDNLHSLKLLVKAHKGKVDVIYIDPPYNTKNKDFVYNDCKIGEDDYYRHSKWLSFMSERLKLAEMLMSKTGCIFISIDDNEQANLKLLCDEIFGENRFVALIPWRKRTAKSDVPFGLSQDCESILCYANEGFLAGTQANERRYYESPDFPGQPWRIHDLTKQTTASERPNSFFTIINPKTGEEYPANPNATWRITVDTFDDYYKSNRIVFPGDYDFLKISKPVLRYWKCDDEAKAGENFGMTSVSTFLPSDKVGMTQDGTKEITNIFGSKVFNFPKPSSLIKYLLEIATLRNPNALILDFFAGTGTTAQAVMELNTIDGGNRHFILCTNNEAKICETITYERVKKVIEGYSYNGKKETIIFEKKISLKDLQNIEKVLEKANTMASQHSYKYNSVKTEMKDGILKVVGLQNKEVTVQGIPNNLKYYRTDFIKKDCEDLCDKLICHIVEMIQLEYGVKVDNKRFIMIMSDEELDELELKISEYSELEAIFINQDVLLSSAQEKMLQSINTYIIPNYYFDFELREAGEIW